MRRVFDAQLGETQLALEHLEEAFKLGYGDFYNVRENNDPVVSLAPIRKNPEIRRDSVKVQEYILMFMFLKRRLD